jgi:hypothetical protein
LVLSRERKGVERIDVNFRLERVARIARESADNVYKRQCGLDILHIRVLRLVAESPGQAVNAIVRESMLEALAGFPDHQPSCLPETHRAHSFARRRPPIIACRHRGIDVGEREAVPSFTMKHACQSILRRGNGRAFWNLSS